MRYSRIHAAAEKIRAKRCATPPQPREIDKPVQFSESAAESADDRQAAFVTALTDTIQQLGASFFTALSAALKNIPASVIENHVHVPEQAPPPITVEGTTVQVAAPAVTVSPAQVVVQMPPPQSFDMVPVRDEKTKLIERYKSVKAS